MKPFNSHGQSFNEIPIGSPKRSSFNKTYTHKSSGRLGRIIPIHAKEVLPSEQLRLNPKALLRFEPLAVPMLSNCHQRIHNYIVPMRQVWSNWETFITRGKSQTEDLEVPSVTLNNVAQNLTSRLIAYASRVYYNTDDNSGFHTYDDDFKRYLRDVINSDMSVDVTSFNKIKPVLSHIGLKINYNGGLINSSLNELNYDNFEGSPNPFGTDRNYLFFNLVADSTDLTDTDNNKLGYNRITYGTYICQLIHFLYLIHKYYFDDGYEETVIYLNNYRFANTFQNESYKDILNYQVEPVIRSLINECYSLIYQAPVATQLSGVDLCYSNISLQAFEDLITRVFYETLVQPFIGESSNWSYMGYPALTFDMFKAGSLFAGNAKLSNTIGAICNLNPIFVLGNVDDAHKEIFDSTSDYYINNSDFESYYINLPVSLFENVTKFSVLPLRALYRIWWFNYRDQRIEEACLDPDDASFKADSVTTPHIFTLLIPRYIAWAKDTFTTATLNSFTSNVIVPLGDDVNVATIPVQVNELDDEGNIIATQKEIALPQSCVSQGSDVPRLGLDGLSLSMLRKCQALASWLDKNLFIGYQYADQLYSHYGVKYSDARLQIPEYVGGNSSVVNIEIITNNTNTGSDPENLVDVAGRQSSRMQGYAECMTKGYFSEEHAYCITLMSVLPESSYPDAVDRSLLMHNTFDVAMPEFSQTGSDIVSAGEVAFNPLHNGDQTNLEPFGYQGRYYHYKSNFDRVSGNLRTTRKEFTFARFFQNPELDVMYLPRSEYSYLESSQETIDQMSTLIDRAYTRPVLTPEFIHCLPATYMFVSQYDDQFIFDSQIVDIENLPLPLFDEVY